MSDLAPLLQGFFTDKLMLQLQASPHTIAAYRDIFTLLLGFAEQRTGRPGMASLVVVYGISGWECAGVCPGRTSTGEYRS
ncbi:hypothetical protein ACWCQP_49300, partial [Streptomyces chartreusis]